MINQFTLFEESDSVASDKTEMSLQKNIFPAITLYQPWATWIVRGWKTIETRTHNRFASLKGQTILIHAGQKTDDSDLTVKNPYLTQEQILHNPDEVINGFVLGSAYVTHTGRLFLEHSAKSLIECQSIIRYGLFLEKISRWDNPVPCKGEMGIWYFDMESLTKVKKIK